MVGTCCSLRGKIAAYELLALGEIDLCGRMYQDMTVETTLAFAEGLVRAADRLEAIQRDPDHPLPGAGANGNGDVTTKEVIWQSDSTFDESLASIREAARWYAKVGTMGYGVHVWY